MADTPDGSAFLGQARKIVAKWPVPEEEREALVSKTAIELEQMTAMGLRSPYRPEEAGDIYEKQAEYNERRAAAFRAKDFGQKAVECLLLGIEGGEMPTVLPVPHRIVEGATL